MANDNNSSTSSYLPAQVKDIAQVLSLGIASGILIVLLGELMQRFFINPVFCNNATGGDVCGPNGLTGFYAATLIVTLLSIVTLARLNIFRPLLIAVGAAVALWGMKGQMLDLSLLEYAFWTAVLFGLAYLLFYWLLRAQNFVLSLGLVVVAAVVLRLLLVL